MGVAEVTGDPVPEMVAAAARPMLEAEGYDLVLVEHLAPSHILRLYIDKLEAFSEPMGSARHGVELDGSPITIEDCTQVSRWVSDMLDAEGISETIPGTFNLEVSSPGLDRPLVRPRDFCRFLGSEIRVTAKREAASRFADRRRFKGVLKSADQTADGGIAIEVDGRLFEIEYPLIEQARLVPDFWGGSADGRPLDRAARRR